VRHHGLDDNASLFNPLEVGMAPAYLFAKADLGESMTEASIDLQQPTFRHKALPMTERATKNPDPR
jgi:hypothetical protein